MLRKIAWKSIAYKPLNTALSVSLILFGVGIISLVLLIQSQLEQKFERDLEDIDLVMGAKGSPLQLVLSAVYHLDAPTGNIKLAEARKIMNQPMVETAIPLAYGDSYRGYRILGTSSAFLKKYQAQLASGESFATPMEVTLGADVAEKTRLKIGDTFLGTHGEVQEGHVHEEHPYTVVGILERSNNNLDRLVLTNIESVWQVHNTHEDHEHAEEHDHAHEEGHEHAEEHDHDHEEGHEHAEEHDHDHEGGHEHAEEHDHDHAEGHEHAEEHDHDHAEGHEHAEEHDHDHEEGHEHTESLVYADSMEITAVLLKYKSKMAVLNMPRIINEQTNMQAVIPSLEINRLFFMLGIGATSLKLIAAGIMIMAGFSVFFVLYSRLRDRKYELALMRSVGYRPAQLFALLLIEGLLITAIGYFLGWLVSRAGIFFINRQAESDFHIQFGTGWIPEEAWLLVLTLLVGLVSALLPAIQAMRMDVSAVLSES
ncbi:MAG: FtsX-like permease family protein [Bacteroidota bacterium]